MPRTDATGWGWRARWAGRENERRQRAYDTAVDAWRLRDDELRRLRGWASAFRGAAETTAGLLVDLHDDEVVFSVQPAVELVEAEARHVAGLPAPGLAEVPVSTEALTSTLPTGIRVMDAGMAIVTDRRVVFLGRRGTCEWRYAQLTGLAHHPAAPFTLMHSRDRKKISGLLLPPAAVSRFRFNLTLAFVDTVEQRAVVVAQLDELLAAHQAARPSAPVPATWAQAPLTAAVSAPQLAAAGVVAIALLTLVGGTFRGDSIQRPWPEAATAVGATTAGTATTGTATTGTTTTGTATTGTTTTGNAATTSTGTGTGTDTDTDTGTTAASAPTAAPATGQPGVAFPDPPGAPQPTPPMPVATTGPAGETGSTGDPAANPQPSTASPAPTGNDLCGAPSNPYGYNYCGGSIIHEPASDVCSYFACVGNFFDGHGYMVLCGDGIVSMLGGRGGSCSGHGGTRRPVYQ